MKDESKSKAFRCDRLLRYSFTHFSINACDILTFEDTATSSESLNACNPIRLGLALNFSVFHYEVMNSHKQACELGEQALSDALEKIDDVDEETCRDAKSIIELLKENLSLWKEEEDQNNVEDL